MLNILISAIEDINEDKAIKIVKKCINLNIEKESIWIALNQGLQKVGMHYEAGRYSIADLMVVGMIFEEIILLPHMNIYGDIENIANNKSVILGTVKGDIHDLGKSIFKGAMQSAGFRIIDLGVDVKSNVFVEKAIEYNSDIIGVSAVLTDSIHYVKEVIENFERANIRKQVKIIIGGCIANKTVCDYVGADAYTKSAIKGVEICKGWL